MSELDWMFDDYDEPFEVPCRRCGEEGLTWDDSTGSWRLVDRIGTPHICNPADVLLHAASDFKDCDE